MYCVYKNNYELFLHLCTKRINIRYDNDIIMATTPVPSIEFIKLFHQKGCHLSSHDNILLKNSFKSNRIDVVEYCLNNGVEIRDDDIKFALMGGNPKIINLLLERNINIEPNKYEEIFIDSIKQGKCETITCFVNVLGFGLHNKDLLNKGLLESAINGYYVIAKLLIETGADISYQNYKSIDEAKKNKWYGTHQYLLNIAN